MHVNDRTEHENTDQLENAKEQNCKRTGPLIFSRIFK